jgi:hypothetical protein
MPALRSAGLLWRDGRGSGPANTAPPKWGTRIPAWNRRPPRPKKWPDRNKNENQTNPVQPRAPALGVQNDGDAQRSDNEGAEAEQRENDDLLAQQEMAEAARRMLYLTRLQLLIGAIGTAFLLAALFYTARATRAAIEANEINRTAYIAAQRAWLNVRPVIESDLTLHKNVAILDVSVTTENIGKVPATDIVIRLWLVNTGNRFMGDEIVHYAHLDLALQNRQMVERQGHSLFPEEEMTVKEHLTTGTKRERFTEIGNKSYISLSIIVTINYAFESQQREPITAVAYRLFRTDRTDGWHPGDFRLDEEKIPRDVLRMEPSFGSLIR